MRSTVHVPLHAFDCVRSISESECIGSTHKPKFVSEDEQVKINLYWVHVQPETVSKDEPPQEAFALDSRANQTTSLRTHHLRTHM